MIGYLKGVIKAKGGNYVVLLTSSGVGYKVYLSSLTLAKIKIGADFTCFIHTHVREDQLSLFGFVNEDDLQVFEMLISVSGVGPKTALNIFGAGDGQQIKHAIGSKNKMFFKGVSGLGTKTTEKIFVELENKVGSLQLADGSWENMTHSVDEAVSALMNLGYQKYEIFDFFKRNRGVEEETVEKIVKRFLKK